jgi:hypothetical protein
MQQIFIRFLIFIDKECRRMNKTGTNIFPNLKNSESSRIKDIKSSGSSRKELKRENV